VVLLIIVFLQARSALNSVKMYSPLAGEKFRNGIFVGLREGKIVTNNAPALIRLFIKRGV